MQETNDGFCKHSSCSNGIINHTRTSILNHISCVALQCHDEQQMASQINDTKHAWQRGKELNTMSVVAKFKKIFRQLFHWFVMWLDRRLLSCDLTGARYPVTWPAPAILWLDRRPLSCDLTGARYPVTWPAPPVILWLDRRLLSLGTNVLISLHVTVSSWSWS